jgi:hypothetical protein
MSFRMGDVKMSSVVGAARLHIEAVAAALLVGYGDRAPSIRHTTSIGEDMAKIAPDENGPSFRMDREWRKIMLICLRGPGPKWEIRDESSGAARVRRS